MKGIYLVFGYPSLDLFCEAVKVVEESGFDFLEVGIPFSDPVADGPLLTKAAKAAIESGVNFDRVIEWISLYEGRLSMYVMTYANIIWAKGPEKVAGQLRKAGVKGAIIADLPNSEHFFFKERGFDVPIVPFATPETRSDDLRYIRESDGDFVYFVSIRGTTGQEFFLDKESKGKLEMVKRMAERPVVIGFGISAREHVEEALSVADGFVIGTKAVEELSKGISNFESWCKSLTI